MGLTRACGCGEAMQHYSRYTPASTWLGPHREEFQEGERLGAGERYGHRSARIGPQNRATVSLQVKFSKDFLVTHMRPEFQTRLRASGWWTINREKLASPQQTFGCSSFRVRESEHGLRCRSAAGTPPSFERYPRCAQDGSDVHLSDTRPEMLGDTGLSVPDQFLVAKGEYRHRDRDLTQWLNNWEPIARLNS